jgi:hypothetical protein
MILDGTMVIMACICMTVFHPGIGFGDRWAEAKFSFGRKEVVEVDPEDAVENSNKEKDATSSNEQSITGLGKRTCDGVET